MLKTLFASLVIASAPMSAHAVEPTPDLSWLEVDVWRMGVFGRERAIYKQLGSESCTGDKDAYVELLEAALDDVAPALTSLAYQSGRNECRFSTVDLPYLTGLYEKAARLGYPLAMTVYGRRLIDGYGVDTDVPTGLMLFELDGQMGYGDAGLEAALELIRGEHLAQDLEAAEKVFNTFKEMTPNKGLIERVEKELAQAKAAAYEN
ncbi:MAG: hypothetical protein GY767_21125 [Shimia sp.]|nr:hypothetical protein [Shimia sp.]